MRDLRIFRIFEGTNEILRLFVSLTGLQVSLNEASPWWVEYIKTRLMGLQIALDESTAGYWERYM